MTYMKRDRLVTTNCLVKGTLIYLVSITSGCATILAGRTQTIAVKTARQEHVAN
jgi:hypothetical protein